MSYFVLFCTEMQYLLYNINYTDKNFQKSIDDDRSKEIIPRNILELPNTL